MTTKAAVWLMMMLTVALMLTFAALVIVSQPRGEFQAAPTPTVYDSPEDATIVVEGALP